MDPLDDDAVVCLVGAPIDAISGVGDVAADHGVEIRECDATDVDDVDPALVLCDGGDALVELVERGARQPILPIEPARRSTDSTNGPVVTWNDESAIFPGVSREEAVDTFDSLVQGGGVTNRRSTLSVETENSTARAAFDVALVTDEPGTIATFTADADGDAVADVRADGLVVATPTGSRGYARAAGGPVIAADAQTVTLVSIGPFTTRRPVWVGPPDGLTLSLGPDGPAATLQCDGRVRDTIPAGSTLGVQSGPALSIVTPD